MARERWWSAGIGVVAVAVGWWLLFRPFASLSLLMLLVVVGLLVMAAARLAEAARPYAPLELAPAAAYALAAVAIVLWPGSAVVALVWVVALSLLVDGVVALVRAVRESGPGRIAAALRGAAGNLTGLITNLDEVTAGSIFAAYVLDGYAATYDDVDIDDYVRGAAEVQVEEMATRCLSGPGALLDIAEYLTQDTSVFDTDPATGALGARLAENVPSDPIAAPLLLAQGETDPLVIPSAQGAYAEQRCASGGGPVDYRTYADRDHVGVVADDSPLVPDLLEWTAQRFAGEPAADTCG